MVLTKEAMYWSREVMRATVFHGPGDIRGCGHASEIRRLTGGGVNVAIEALGTQPTFENALRVLRPGGMVLAQLADRSGTSPRPPSHPLPRDAIKPRTA